MENSKIMDRMRVLHKNLADSRAILVDGIVSEQIGLEIESVIDVLSKSGDHADIYVNSPGGSADAFIGIIKKMKSCGMTFTTMCLDVAGCGAMLLLAAGDRRVCLRKSSISMFQPLWVKDPDKSEDDVLMKAGAAIMRTKGEIESMFGEFTKKGSKSLSDELFEARTITPSEALEAGIVDYVAG